MVDAIQQKPKPKVNQMITFAIVATPRTAAEFAFEVHAAGCRDLRTLATPFDHMVDARRVEDAVAGQVAEFGGVLKGSDFTVMPCCNPRRCAAAGRVRPDPTEC